MELKEQLSQRDAKIAELEEAFCHPYKEKEEEVKLAKVGEKKSFGVAFVVGGIAIGASIISLGAIDSMMKVIQYISLSIIIGVLLPIGTIFIRQTRKESEELLNNLLCQSINGKNSND
jgi:hypothetical protein